MYPQHKVTQVNIVFDCLENYEKDLKTQVYYHVILTNQTTTNKLKDHEWERNQILLQKSQKWILSQNVEIANDYTIIKNLLSERTREKELDILLERYTQEKTIRKLRLMTLA